MLSLEEIGLWLLSISLPILAVYFGYLIITRAFKNMGFSSVEAIIIVFLSALLGYGFFNSIIGISFNNLPLFQYNNWQVGINTGGAIIPIALSIYLGIKHRYSLKRLGLGIIIVSIVTYLVTQPNPEKGIVAVFPLWIAPILAASIVSFWFLWDSRRNPGPFAYICGTMGVLIGADIFHLIELLQMEISSETPAIIGGAVVFDMVFITGILAVLLDGVVTFQNPSSEKKKTTQT